MVFVCFGCGEKWQSPKDIGGDIYVSCFEFVFRFFNYSVVYVKSDCLRWVKVGSLKVFCLHLQKSGTTARSLAAVESRKNSLRMTWDNQKKHGF